jgi:hypothetical protein
MAYGLRIINDASELLIDSDYVNPTFVQKLEFNTTPSAGEEYGSLQLHPGYTRRFYSTPTVSIGTGNYIVLWALPDSIVAGQPEKDVWYLFPTSVAQNNLQFDCSVFANSSTSSTSYTLPTAYIFTVDANGIEAMSSTGAALRMYNAATPQKKTFDSNFTQLVPYSITDNFALPTNDTATSLYLATPTNPIYLLPKTAVAFAQQRTASGVNYTDYKVFDIAFKRRGSYIDSKTMSTAYESEQGNFTPGFVNFFAGTYTNLSIIAADADLYQAPGGGTGGGSNPTYNLSRSASSVNEGGSFTITLTTTNVVNGTTVGYNVTGIQESDLSSGVTTGNFTISNNTASVGFTVANDSLTEGPETFRLEILAGTYPYIDVNINDTSVTPPATPTYSISPQTGNVNEGSSITFTVTTINVANTTLYWAINGGSADPGADFSAYNGSFALTSGTGTFSVTPVADTLTEGSQTFSVGVRTGSVSGTEQATTGTITINDTSITPPIVYNESLSISPGTVSLSNYTTISISGGQPNATFGFSVLNNGDPQPSSYPGSASLNGSGNFSNYLTGATITGGPAGNKRIWVYFPYNGNVRNAQVNVVEDSGTPVGGQYCVGYTLTQNYANGTGGTYASAVEYNSASCGYNPPAANQPVGSPYCVGTTRYQDYTDGNYGTYAGVIEYNSTACGYTPPTATWDAVFSNNGSAGQIYCGVNVYLSAPAPTTVTFTFSGLVTNNGASFNVPSVTITAGNTASAGYEYSGFTNGSGPYGTLTLVVSPSSAPYSISPSSTSYPGFLYSN